MAALDNYRYKRSEKEEEPGIDRDTSETGSEKTDSGKKVLRSGRLYQIDIKRIGDKTGKEAEKSVLEDRANIQKGYIRQKYTYTYKTQSF